MSVNGGLPANHSAGLSLNRRTERFNLFAQLGAGYRSVPTDVVTENRDLAAGTLLRSTGEEFRDEQFYNLVLGTDYTASERDVITLSGNFAYEVEEQPSGFAFARTDLRDDAAPAARWRRTEDTEATNPKYQFDVQWARDFDAGRETDGGGDAAERPRGGADGGGREGGGGGRPGRRGGDEREHQLVTSVTGSLFAKDQSSVFTNEVLAGDVEVPARQRTRTDFGEVETVGKVDYTRPLGASALAEAGAQVAINDVSNDFAVADERGGAFVVDPGLTNVFDWDQRVYAAYGAGAEQFGPLGVKAGVRVEHTQLETLLRTTGEANDQRYTDLFPSAALSYELTEAVSFQASYSRRISRPRLWDLNPFFNIRNNFNFRAGNPDLGPEYSDSYEATAILIAGELSLNGGVYHARTTDLVERVTTFADGVAVTQPFNVGTQNSTGLEVNGKYAPTPAVTLRGDLNASAFAREGAFGEQAFDFTGRQWSGRLAAKLKTAFDLEAELTGRYRSGFETFQGRVAEQAWLDLGVRQALWGGRGSLNLSVRDLLASRVRETFVFADDFETYGFNQRGRFVTLGFSYGFGRGDAMEYLGQRRRY